MEIKVLTPTLESDFDRVFQNGNCRTLIAWPYRIITVCANGEEGDETYI